MNIFIYKKKRGGKKRGMPQEERERGVIISKITYFCSTVHILEYSTYGTMKMRIK
jgi:hypothetical protein